MPLVDNSSFFLPRGIKKRAKDLVASGETSSPKGKSSVSLTRGGRQILKRKLLVNNPNFAFWPSQGPTLWWPWGQRVHLPFICSFQVRFSYCINWELSFLYRAQMVWAHVCVEIDLQPERQKCSLDAFLQIHTVIFGLSILSLHGPLRTKLTTSFS